jgi:hypothetical protein
VNLGARRFSLFRIEKGQLKLITLDVPDFVKHQQDPHQSESYAYR